MLTYDHALKVILFRSHTRLSTAAAVVHTDVHALKGFFSFLNRRNVVCQHRDSWMNCLLGLLAVLHSTSDHSEDLSAQNHNNCFG